MARRGRGDEKTAGRQAYPCKDCGKGFVESKLPPRSRLKTVPHTCARCGAPHRAEKAAFA